MQTGGAYFVGCLKKFKRFFYIDTFQIVISIYKRIVRIFFRKIYGREINGINQGSYLNRRISPIHTGRILMKLRIEIPVRVITNRT